MVLYNLLPQYFLLVKGTAFYACVLLLSLISIIKYLRRCNLEFKQIHELLQLRFPYLSYNKKVSTFVFMNSFWITNGYINYALFTVHIMLNAKTEKLFQNKRGNN